MAGELEDAGADHGFDTDHGRVEEAEGPGEREFRGLGSFGVRDLARAALLAGMLRSAPRPRCGGRGFVTLVGRVLRLVSSPACNTSP